MTRTKKPSCCCSVQIDLSVLWSCESTHLGLSVHLLDPHLAICGGIRIIIREHRMVRMIHARLHWEKHPICPEMVHPSWFYVFFCPGIEAALPSSWWIFWSKQAQPRKCHFSEPEEHLKPSKVLKQGNEFRFRSGRMRQLIHHAISSFEIIFGNDLHVLSKQKINPKDFGNQIPKDSRNPKTLLFRIFRAPGGPESFACFMTTSSLLDKSRAKNAWRFFPQTSE